MSRLRTLLPASRALFDNLLSQPLVIDVETTIYPIEDKKIFGASPYIPANSLVAVGIHAPAKDGTKVHIYYDMADSGFRYVAPGLSFVTPTLLVGHNISFDLQWLLRETLLSENSFNHVVVWDTMVAQHYLSGQRENKSLSLENVASEWDIAFTKQSEVTDSFKLGIGSDKVEPTLLKEYLKEDVLITKNIYQAQLDFALEYYGVHFIRYMLGMMQSIKATTRMSLTGMSLEVNGFYSEYRKAQAIVSDLEQHLSKTMSQLLPPDLDVPTITPNSPMQVALALWGGDYNAIQKVPMLDDNQQVLLYKSGPNKGTPRTKKIRSKNAWSGLLQPPIATSLLGKTDEHTLRTLLSGTLSATAEDLIGQLLAYRREAKNLSTYYGGLDKHLVGGVIHPSYNHAITRTKRLSSSGPNMQNISNKGDKT